MEEKKSEQLKKAAQAEDNDLKALGLMTGSMREARQERFVEDVLPRLLKAGVDVTYHEKGYHYVIDTPQGLAAFYPKSNKLMLHKGAKWIKPGLQWIITNLLGGKVTRDKTA